MKKDKIERLKGQSSLFNKENKEFNRGLLSKIDIDKKESEERERKRLYDKKYLGEIIEEEEVEFGSNNLILAPVGSGKTYLIEEMLIPKDYKKDILYLTSNTALKDALAPNDNELRKLLAENGQSENFYTTENKKHFGNNDYKVHVMSYHEFGLRIDPPYQTFTEGVGLIFCDEIHSLPIFREYGQNSGELNVALRWLFTKHDNIDIFYFTATNDSIERLGRNSSGYLNMIETFDYLAHPGIRQYEANSIYYINRIEEVREHLRARIDSVNRNGYKGLAFTKLIKSQKVIEDIAIQEGYKPLVLWSINNDKIKMSKEQTDARDKILETGLIPEPYNLLIINGSMQEGWDLYDRNVMFSIMDTLDNTERVQALGRIRKDIDFVVYKSEEERLSMDSVFVKELFLDKQLTQETKELLCEDLNLKGQNGEALQWRGVKPRLIDIGYEIIEDTIVINGKRRRVSTIKLPKDFNNSKS